MRAELLNLSIFAPKKLCGGRTVNCSEIPHYAYTWPLCVSVKRHPTRKWHIWFLPTHSPTLKNQKSHSFPTLRQNPIKNLGSILARQILVVFLTKLSRRKFQGNERNIWRIHSQFESWTRLNSYKACGCTWYWPINAFQNWKSKTQVGVSPEDDKLSVRNALLPSGSNAGRMASSYARVLWVPSFSWRCVYPTRSVRCLYNCRYLTLSISFAYHRI